MSETRVTPNPATDVVPVEQRNPAWFAIDGEVGCLRLVLTGLQGLSDELDLHQMYGQSISTGVAYVYETALEDYIRIITEAAAALEAVANGAGLPTKDGVQ